jgi:predicted O-linked N-acetylglucosamine transferase (SPINDLY family)
MNTISIQGARRAHQIGNRSEAVRLCREILRLNPRDFDALYLLGYLHSQAGELEEAERLIAEALKINPYSSDAAYNRGCILQTLARHAEALACFDQAIAINARFLDAIVNRGISLRALKRPVEALASFDRALELKSDDAECWNSRATALMELGQPGEALASLGRALALNADYADAWSNRGVALHRLRRHAEALGSFAKSLALNPNSFTAWSNRGSTLMDLHRFREAIQDLDRALVLRPDYLEACINRGIAFTALKEQDRALASFAQALKAHPGSTEALYNRANTFMVFKRFEEAAKDCESLLKLDPEYKYARGFLAFFRLQCCDWRALDSQRTAIATSVRAGKCAVPPFAAAALLDAGADQLSAARICVADKYPPTLQPLWREERYQHRKIRLAYLSGDFNNTAVANLMAGVFEHHDTSRFETIAVSFTEGDGSEMRARLRRSFGRFIDVWNVSDAEVAGFLRQNEIDIAVDLMGFTGDSRPGILALRPAPMQVNHLGFPGTMGAGHIDYILADPIVIPKEARGEFDEAVLHLPDCFMPTDSVRPIARHAPSRAEAGLPAQGFVFCSFNNSYKFTPEMFASWMRLLKAVPESVLWLPQPNDPAMRNLQREAEAGGVARDRLVFAPFIASSADHLARLSLAELFLDTRPYNAHSSAADALWAGVPVLTFPGATFAGRVGASLLHAAGLPELVTDSIESYEALALELAQSRAVLDHLKARLKRGRRTQPLFDTARFTRHLESAYVAMWERYQKGEPPAHFAVSPAEA